MKTKMISVIIIFIWVGMILAIGMESIVKFQTVTLPKPVGFDVGRVVFAAFNQVQLFLLASLILGMMLSRETLLTNSTVAILALILLTQVFLLFPTLSHRVDIILAGKVPPPTYFHALYGLLEVAKIFLLFVLGVRLFLNLLVEKTSVRF